jgi:tRNA nucleotidyltransferase/poly(A) polymerase
MPEYIYLLENRLTPAQQHALTEVRDAARGAGMTVFLAGGAVRDLTTGSSVRNLNFTVQGNALELESLILGRGAELWGEHEPTRTLTFWLPGSVLVTVASARSEDYPKPGQPVYRWSTIVEDLRRRDFTANAMALSLNEGSYGLLLDPLNGVADIEARLLRLGSNYGFIEDPSRLIRATRLHSRLGWQFEDRTATRYANAKEANAIQALSPYLRGYELERVASEEDAFTILQALDAEGWTEHLQPGWSAASADVPGLENLRRNWIQLLMQGVTSDLTAVHLELLTAKLDSTHRAELKQSMIHPGLLQQWEALEESSKEFAKLVTGKAASTPSATWKLFTNHQAEPILWLSHTRKGSAVETKFKNFFTVWPEFRKKVPTVLMQEMRITPEMPGYTDLLEQLFFQMIDGNLETEEALRAFLEPFSPPAPPPPPTVRRSRAKKSESKTKRRTAAPDDEDDDEDADLDSDADDLDDDDVIDEEEDEDEAEGVLDLPLPDIEPDAAADASEDHARDLEGEEEDDTADAETDSDSGPEAEPDSEDEAPNPPRAAKKGAAEPKVKAAKPPAASSPASKVADKSPAKVPAKSAASPKKAAPAKPGKKH